MSEDAILDQVTQLWRDAKELEADARLAEQLAKETQQRADDLFEQAEELYRPLLDDHPEWEDALIEQFDPRDSDITSAMERNPDDPNL